MTDYEKHIEYNSEYIIKLGYDPKEMWDLYHKEVFPFLSVITQFRLAETKATYQQIRLALGITNGHWKVYKKCFRQLNQALKSKQSIMEFKAQIDLQKHLVNTEYKNPKGIEMQGLRYDENWKTKTSDVVVEMPKTLQVEISNKKKTPEELKPFATIDD